MSFWDKLGRGVAAFSTGVAAGLPVALQQRRSIRQEARYDRRLDLQEISARKQEIRALYNTGPIGREEALRQAGELNDPSFVAELQSTFPAREQERLQTASRSLSTTTAGEAARIAALPIGSEQERATAVSESTSALGNISAAQSLMESLGGIKREPVSVDVLGQGPLPGNSISAQDFFGATDETKNAFLQAEQAKEQLGTRVGSLAQFEQDRRNIDPFTSPDDLNRIVDVLKQSYLSAGGTASQFVGVERQLRRELLSDRDAAFDDMAVIADDPNYIRELAVKWNVSPSMEKKGEARAKLLETRMAQDVPENVRFVSDQALSAWARGQELASHGQTELAKETLEFAADTVEGVNPRLAGFIREGIEATLKTGTTARAEDIYQYWSRQLAEPFGDESIRRAIQATDPTFPSEGKIYIEDIWKAAQAVSKKSSSTPESASSIPSSTELISIKFGEILNRKFSTATSPDSLDLRMLQAEEALALEPDSTRSFISQELSKQGWIYDPNENRFARERAIEGILPAIQKGVSKIEPTLTAVGGAAAAMLTGKAQRTFPLGAVGSRVVGSLADQLIGTSPLPGKSTFASSEEMKIIRTVASSLGIPSGQFKELLGEFKKLQQTLKRVPTEKEFSTFLQQPTTP